MSAKTASKGSVKLVQMVLYEKLPEGRTYDPTKHRTYNVVIVTGESIQITTTGVNHVVAHGHYVAQLGFTVSKLNDAVVARCWFGSLTHAERCELGEILASGLAPVARDWINDHGGHGCAHWLAYLYPVGRVDDVPFTETRTFRVGEQAEHSSFNLSYFDEIMSITAKTVTFRDDGASGKTKTKRLTIQQFVERNWNFDLTRERKKNSEWMD